MNYKKDISRLTPKRIIDKLGRRMTVYVKVSGYTPKDFEKILQRMESFLKIRSPKELQRILSSVDKTMQTEINPLLRDFPKERRHKPLIYLALVYNKLTNKTLAMKGEEFPVSYKDYVDVIKESIATKNGERAMYPYGFLSTWFKLKIGNYRIRIPQYIYDWLAPAPEGKGRLYEFLREVYMNYDKLKNTPKIRYMRKIFRNADITYRFSPARKFIANYEKELNTVKFAMQVVDKEMNEIKNIMDKKYGSERDKQLWSTYIYCALLYNKLTGKVFDKNKPAKEWNMKFDDYAKTIKEYTKQAEIRNYNRLFEDASYPLYAWFNQNIADISTGKENHPVNWYDTENGPLFKFMKYIYDNYEQLKNTPKLQAIKEFLDKKPIHKTNTLQYRLWANYEQVMQKDFKNTQELKHILQKL